MKRWENPIRFLRVVRVNEICTIAKITDYQKKKGEVIAACTINMNFEGNYAFKISPGDAGHRDLCCLLRKNGINGTYREWLKAIEEGNDTFTKEKSTLPLLLLK